MATTDIEHMLRKHYAARRAQPTKPPRHDDAGLDYCLISRYLDGTATPDECSEVKRLAAKDAVVAEMLASMMAERKRAHEAARGIVLPFHRHWPHMIFKLAACAVLALGGVMAYVATQHDWWRVAYRGIATTWQPEGGANGHGHLLIPEPLPHMYSGSFALLIGNGDYSTNGWPSLKGPVNEVCVVADRLNLLGFDTSVHTNLTKQEFESVLNKFVCDHGGTTNSRVLIYYAGHGWEDGDLVMVDAADPDEDRVGCMNGCVHMDTIVSETRKMKARHVLCMFNSCCSGSILDTRGICGTPGRQFIAATSSNGFVRDDTVFQDAFLDMLTSRVPDPVLDGFITAGDVYKHLAQVLPKQHDGQQPQYWTSSSCAGPDEFVFAQYGKPAATSMPPDDVTVRLKATAQAVTPLSTNPAQCVQQIKSLCRQHDYSNSYALAVKMKDVHLDDPSVLWYWRVMAFQGMHGQVYRIVKDPALVEQTEEEYKAAEHACSGGKYFDYLQYQWGHFYRAQGLRDDAIDRFEWIQQHAPNSIWKEGTAYYLARLYIERGETNKAVREVERLSQFSPAAFVYEVDQREYIHVSNALATVSAAMGGSRGK